jgi:hypothetical protein
MLTGAPVPNNHGNPRTTIPEAPPAARVKEHALASVTNL